MFFGFENVFIVSLTTVLFEVTRVVLERLIGFQSQFSIDNLSGIRCLVAFMIRVLDTGSVQSQ